MSNGKECFETTVVMHLVFYFEMVIAASQRDCEASKDSERIR